MKRIITAAATAAVLLAGTAVGTAADMAVKARPMAPPPVIWSWTGFYIGGHVGAGWGTTESTLTGATITAPFIRGGSATFPFTLPFSQTSSSGFLGGVQAGANWQTGWAVLGVQGDIAGADIKGTSPCLVILACSTRTDWLASVTGRIGAVVLDRGLVYVKGGGAWMDTKHSVTTPNFGLGTGIPNEIASREITHFGWTVGLGTEWMITPNWTAFVEYNYYEFDKKNYAFPLNLGPNLPFAVTVNADLRNTLSVAKVGVNYKFGWGGGPVVARY
jgi:outer membrane immunogenic protein